MTVAEDKAQEQERHGRPPNPRPRKRDIILQALTRTPSRQKDQAFYWLVTATRDLGFPIVVALVLLLKMPGWIREAVAADAAVRAEQHKALLDAIDRSSRAFAETTATLAQLTERAEALQSTSDTVKGMVLGRLKCPTCPSCRCPAAPSCPTLRCPDVHVAPAPTAAPPSSPPRGSGEPGFLRGLRGER